MNKVPNIIFSAINNLLKYRVINMYVSLCVITGIYVSTMFFIQVGIQISTLEFKPPTWDSKISIQKIKENTIAAAIPIKDIDTTNIIETIDPLVEPVEDDNLANTYSNMTYSFKKDEPEVSKTSKKERQIAYVKRFASISRKEMRKYGIPASIKLAQGLIETNAGDSRLAKQNNNHFGMKCFSKKCGKGHCANFTDDSHKDFFRKYKSAWESYRAHSQLLMGKRYRHLKKLGRTDYKGWARGLKKAGYATDKRYAEKLIDIIEEMNLNKHDS